MPFTSIPNEILGRAINDAEFRNELRHLTTAGAVSDYLMQQGMSLSPAAAEEIANFNTDPAFQATIRQELGLDETAM